MTTITATIAWHLVAEGRVPTNIPLLVIYANGDMTIASVEAGEFGGAVSEREHRDRTNMKTIIIDGVEYVPAGTQPAVRDDMSYVIIRSADSGVHAGWLESRVGGEVVLRSSRRLWFWTGAATLSQLAQEGVKTPADCKFPCVLPEITVLGVCEIIPATEAARQSIEEVPVWAQ